MHYSAQLYCKPIIFQRFSQVVCQNRSCNIVHVSMRSYVLLRRKLRLLYSTTAAPPVAVVLIKTVLCCYSIVRSAVLSMPSNYRIFRVV